MPVQPLATSMRFPAGGRLGGAEGMQITIQVNTGDLMRISSKLNGARVQIHPGLRSRAQNMTDQAVKALDSAAPKGQGGDWARGTPPLQGSHRGAVINAFYAVVYTEARHARPIVYGFTPHMPPASAWLGDPELSFVMRRAVLHNETPENPRDYFTPVADALVGFNTSEAERLGARLAAAMSAG